MSTGTMKAIVYTAPGVFEYTDVPRPTLAPDEALLRVRACGLCRTDMHIHLGHFISAFPLINGHEFAGEVAGLGADVSELAVGDRVVADNTELCGRCFHCRRDEPLYCQEFTSHGCNCAGGFAEYVAIKAEKVFRIDRLSWREAVMAEPTACAVHGVDRIGPRPGSEVLLFGAGPTGLILAQLLKANGAASLTVAAPAGKKLQLAEQLGADEVVAIDRSDPDVHRERLARQHPRGFDVVVEATGSVEVFADCFRFARRGATVVAYGVYDEQATVPLSPYQLFYDEINVIGSFAQTHCFDRALLYLERGTVKVDRLVDCELPLVEYGRALEKMERREAVKIALCP
jgi:D-arabinitol dehydrogenase (NADP+)